MTKKTPIEKVEAKRDLAREAAIEATPVRMDGVGEPAAIQAAMSLDFAQGSNMQALDVALMLQQLVKGNASILENQAAYADELVRIKTQMAKYDEDAKKWEANQTKFLEDLNKNADKLRITDPAKRGEIAARVMVEEKEIRAMANAEAATARISFEKLCVSAPRVTVVSPGVMEQGVINDQPITRLAPDVIRIKNKSWILKPGVPTEVPDFVAKRFYQIQQGREEVQARQNALSADRNNGAMSDAAEVTREMARIDKKYGNATNSA